MNHNSLFTSISYPESKKKKPSVFRHVNTLMPSFNEQRLPQKRELGKTQHARAQAQHSTPRPSESQTRQERPLEQP